jgi:flavin-dependent dehydrogenase
LIEASSYDKPRIGEVLPSVARPFLEHLGVWEAFQAERFRLVHSTSSAWGHPSMWESHFIYSLHGAGWHLDRARFDAFMARQAARREVLVRLSTRLVAAERSGNGWTLRLSDGSQYRARFVVDATGRHAAFARKTGARLEAFDRLTGFARFFTVDDDSEQGTLIEAFSEGWWYTATAGERRVVTCMTDSDVARRLGLGDEERWLKLLSETRWIRGRVGCGTLYGAPLSRAANSLRLHPVIERDWLAVGDAATAFDPLSSQGIVKSLRAGIFASYAIADLLGKADAEGLARYESFVHREFDVYLRSHAQYCAAEQRWPDSSFWRRRHRMIHAIASA